MQTTCPLYAKIIKTSRGTVRVLYSFDSQSKITVTNCAYTSGDLGVLNKSNLEQVSAQVSKTHAFVKRAFSTDNVVVVKSCLV
jgi:hypothetical protein